MTRGLATALLIGVAGCDLVLGLDAPAAADAGSRDAGPRDAALTCAYAQPLAPGADEDQDGVLNGADACPRAPDTGTAADVHDEDGDGIADRCDACPALPLSGGDEDCDQVGAACDPDDAVAHTRRFFGFDSTTGLTLDADMVVEGDQLVFRPGPATYGQARITAATLADGTYQLHARVSGLSPILYWELGYSLDLTSGGLTTSYRAELGVYDGFVSLFAKQAGATGWQIEQTAGASVGATADLTLRLRVTGNVLTLSVTGDVQQVLEATLPEPAAARVVGVISYEDPTRDGTASPLVVGIDYLSETLVAP